MNKANIKVPEFYTLTPAKGYLSYGEGRCYYRKNDSGLVHLNFAITPDNDGTFPVSTPATVLIIPKGYIPDSTVRFTAAYSKNVKPNLNTPASDGCLGCYIISGNGSVVVYTDLTDIRWIGGSAIFYAS